MKQLDQILTAIAREHLGIATLENPPIRPAGFPRRQRLGHTCRTGGRLQGRCPVRR